MQQEIEIYFDHKFLKTVKLSILILFSTADVSWAVIGEAF